MTRRRSRLPSTGLAPQRAPTPRSASPSAPVSGARLSTALGSMSEGDLNAITPELVARAADQGDAVATDVIDRAGGWLGITLASAIALLAPEVVVIGGGVAPP